MAKKRTSSSFDTLEEPLLPQGMARLSKEEQRDVLRRFLHNLLTTLPRYSGRIGAQVVGFVRDTVRQLVKLDDADSVQEELRQAGDWPVCCGPAPGFGCPLPPSREASQKERTLWGKTRWKCSQCGRVLLCSEPPCHEPASVQLCSWAECERPLKREQLRGCCPQHAQWARNGGPTPQRTRVSVPVPQLLADQGARVRVLLRFGEVVLVDVDALLDFASPLCQEVLAHLSSMSYRLRLMPPTVEIAEVLDKIDHVFGALRVPRPRARA